MGGAAAYPLLRPACLKQKSFSLSSRRSLPSRNRHGLVKSPSHGRFLGFRVLAEEKGKNGFIKEDSLLSAEGESDGGATTSGRESGGGEEERMSGSEQPPPPPPRWGASKGIRWRELLLAPDPDNVVAVGLTGILALASLQVLWQILLISLAILVAALKYSFVAALLLFILITLL